MLSAVAVVDFHGRLVSNFSGSDLLGLNESNFPRLALPVQQFLCGMYGIPKAPVYVKDSDSVEMVLLKMVVHQVHRVYVVRPSMIPTGVISMTDLMQFFIAESSL